MIGRLLFWLRVNRERGRYHNPHAVQEAINKMADDSRWLRTPEGQRHFRKALKRIAKANQRDAESLNRQTRDSYHFRLRLQDGHRRSLGDPWMEALQHKRR